MDWLKGSIRLRDGIKKYRLAALVLLLGLALMLVPEQQPETTAKPEPVQTEQTLSERLEQLLSQLSGAGKVRVLLTESTGEVTHYQSDESSSLSDSASDRRSDTVILTDGSRQESALVRRVDPPRYLGAVVLCQGADSPAVRLAVVEAVATATGLTTDNITVLKMK